MLWVMPMEPPPRRVFLSHTSELRRFPQGGRSSRRRRTRWLKAGDAVTDMAYFPARHEKPAQVCQDAVAAADVYVLIAGFRYGSPVRDRPQVSYAELEHETAEQRGMPRLVFLLGEDTEGPAAMFADLARAAPARVPGPAGRQRRDHRDGDQPGRAGDGAAARADRAATTGTTVGPVAVSGGDPGAAP